MHVNEDDSLRTSEGFAGCPEAAKCSVGNDADGPDTECLSR